MVVRCSVGRRCVSCGGVFVMVVGLCATTLFGVVVVEGILLLSVCVSVRLCFMQIGL